MSLVAQYRLQENSGTTIYDDVGTNNGTWAGTELIVNGDFANWSGVADPDNEPDDWTVVITGGAVEPTRKLVDATNKCQLITEGNTVELAQTILEVGKTYTYSVNQTARVAGSLRVTDGTFFDTLSTSVGVKTGTFTASSTTFTVKRDSGATNITFTDISVRENVSSVSSPAGSGLLFDGVDDKISVPADTAIDAFGKTALSGSAWIYPVSDGEGNAGRIFDKGDTIVGTTAGYRFFLADESAGFTKLNATIMFEGGTDTDASAVTSLRSIPVNAWLHVAFVYNEDSAKKIKLYVNGVLQSLSTDNAGDSTIADDSAVAMTIGNATEDTTRTFDGSISDVRIYDTALSASEIRILANNRGLTSPFGYITNIRN